MTTYNDRLKGVETSVAVKAPVLAATTSDVTLYGVQTIDDVALAIGDRVLVKDQTSATENGIWLVAEADWTRAIDFNGSRDAVMGTQVFVNSGTLNGLRKFYVTTDSPTIGISDIAFALENDAEVASLQSDILAGDLDGRPSGFAVPRVGTDLVSAIVAGDFDGKPDGYSVQVGGITYVKDSASTSIPGLTGWRFPWQVQKHLLTSDFQPTDSTEVSRLYAAYASISARHPDLVAAHILGDLVDEASQNDTGADPFYSLRDLVTDWRSKMNVPLSSTFFMPGNHDRDGNGLGLFEKAWTMQTYRSTIGPEFYHTLQGNLLNIYVGDMGGSTGGAVTDAVTDWMGRLMRSNRDKNIILNLHHPIAGTYRGFTEAANPTWVQIGSARFTSVLDEVAADADNVAVVFFGHVGSGFQFQDETWHGTRHIQIGMHIPSNVANSRNDQYYVQKWVDGATSFDVEQWDSTADTLLSTKTIALKYPLELAPALTFDGRSARSGLSYTPQEISLSADECRVFNDPTWELEAKRHWALTVGMEDKALDDIPANFGIGIEFKFPGANLSGSEYDAYVVNGTAVRGIGIAYEAKGGTDADPDAYAVISAAENGVVSDAAWFAPSGVHTGHDASVTFNPGNNQVPGATLGSDGYVSAYRTDGVAGYFARSKDGSIVEFNNDAVRAGVITITGATTSYGTTSDMRLKQDMQDFDGLATIEALAVYDHGWISQTGRSRGVMAQDAYLVAPYVVVPGGDDAAKAPWTVDYSKLVPDLVRAVQQLSEQNRAQADRITILEANVTILP